VKVRNTASVLRAPRQPIASIAKRFNVATNDISAGTIFLAIVASPPAKNHLMLPGKGWFTCSSSGLLLSEYK
jgi:hypothetical protein